jgi:hypothetical protein
LVRLAAILLPANGCLILPLAEEAAPHDSQSLLGVPPNAEGSAEAEKRPAEAQANKFDGAKLLHPLVEPFFNCCCLLVNSNSKNYNSNNNRITIKEYRVSFVIAATLVIS